MNSVALADDRRLIALTDNVYVFGSYPYASVVVTDEGCLAIDGPMSPRNCHPWREFIESKGDLMFQIYCEHHQDHTASACYLKPRTLVSSERTRYEMVSTAEMMNAFATWAEDPLLEPNGLSEFEMRYPTITYSERMTILFGGRQFVLYESPGHTAGSTIVHAVQDRVAFIADTGFTPAIQSGDPYAWLSTLAILETLDVDWYVQGHGEPFRREALAVWRGVLLEAIHRARRMRSEGVSVEKIVEDGGVFPHFARSEHVGTADAPPNLRNFSASVLQEQGVEKMFEALDRHPSARSDAPPMPTA